MYYMNILIIHNSVKCKEREKDVAKLSSLSDTDKVKIIEAIFPDSLTEEQIDYYITKKNFGCMPAGYKRPDKIKSTICCAFSHFNALEFIIENKMNDVIIFEDDAILYNENLFEKFLSNRDLFEKNYITYLGGGFFINSKNETTKYVMDTHALYIHNYQQATKLYDRLKNAPKLRAYDNLLKRQIQEKNLPYDYFPIFIQNGEYISNIDGKKKIKSWIELEKSLTPSRELNDKIPKIIHQIYFNLYDKKLEENPIFLESHNNCKSQEGYKYMLWDEEKSLKLLKNDYPQYLEFYKNFRYNIQKIDFIRFCILHKYGGFYIDLDMTILKPLTPLINNTYIFHNIHHSKPNYSFIENDFMASLKDIHIWSDLMKYCVTNYKEKENIEIYDMWKFRFVMQTTGPKFITRYFKQNLPSYKPLKLAYTKWQSENPTDNNLNEYYLRDYKLNSWFNKGSNGFNIDKNNIELDKDYIIAIPSHQRLGQLEKKTLSLLTRHKIDMKKVYVFSSSSSIEEYKNLADKYGFTLVHSKDTILDTRNHIIEYFAENTKIIEMDDDIEDIENTIKSVKNTPVVDLNKIFNNSFEKLNGQGLWGFNANTNNYFACGIDKFGLYSIINSCLGYYNDKRIKLTVSEKEDFERCIQFYKLEIPILKQTQFGIKTRYWKNKGGIQAKYGFEQRIKVQRQSADDIMKKYPVFCYKQTRSNGIVDIRFKKLK